MRSLRKPAYQWLPAWEIWLESPTAFVGHVYADDEGAAIATAIEEHRIGAADQKRLVAKHSGRVPPGRRHFPQPWSVDDRRDCYIVRDHHGTALAYVHFRRGAGPRSALHLLTRDEARHIAADIAKLPELLSEENKKTPRVPLGGGFPEANCQSSHDL
jgi:hypothetical protein